MRVSTAFNRLLAVAGVSVAAVRFERDGVVSVLRLGRIGIDEISYRRGQRYLTLVADHSSGCVVWVGQGHSQQTLAGFFDALGRDRTAALRAISVDMWAAYLKAIRERAPNALVCIDPFHVVQQANLAVDKVRKQEWRRLQQ